LNPRLIVIVYPEIIPKVEVAVSNTFRGRDGPAAASTRLARHR
jgi:hypothetical protein